MTIENYRKKPVVIEAVQWTGANLREIITFTDGPPDTRSRHAGMAWENYEDLVRRDGLKIFTLEGAMLAAPGDWIIKGVKGEFYPCKPEIFAATYEPADAQAALTAIERAAYERGAEAGWGVARKSVYAICEATEDRAVADLEKPQVSEYGTGYLEAEKYTAKSIRRAMGSFEARDDDNFLALLTQEGR